jgi:saccharopine dehydrogenase-like NADP-dependent oxidoreductase
MKQVLIFGAGRSSCSLLQYMEEHARIFNWKIVVVDSAEKAVNGFSDISFRLLDVRDDRVRDKVVQKSDLVISMLPARFHPLVAKSCLKYSKNLFTASYESNELKTFEDEVLRRGLFFLNECGLDPGLDHMSAMKRIDRIKTEGHELLSFESFTGGLVAPESDNNPWHYKFSWNPRNVVLAGQEGPAKFIQNGKFKYIPYHRLFRRTELIDIKGFGLFEGYANRDSLKYIEKYNLQGIPTIYRGTLRRPGFCKAWNVFVQLGATDDSYVLENVENMTHREFINSFLYYHPTDSVELKLYHYMHIDQDSDIIQKLKWLGIFSEKKIGLKHETPARILEHILKSKWQLLPGEKDMVAMWHKFIYREKESGMVRNLTSSLVVTGDDDVHTAMAKTVGLPLAVAAKLFLTGKMKLTGLHIPAHKLIYEPVLAELQTYGISFHDEFQEDVTED